jgi:cytidyltransferase-like protein
MANIALFPGSYKPPHIGHYTAAKQAAKIAGRVIVFVGSGERDGITQDMSVQLWKLYTQNDPNIEVIQSKSSPVTDVYDYVEKTPFKDGDIVYFIKGEKDKDDPRFKNIPKYASANVKDDYIKIPDIKSRTGKEISGRLMRSYIKNNDKKSFIDGLPLGADEEQAWNIVNFLEENTFSKEWWKKILEYTGTGDMASTGPTSGDGNNQTSPRLSGGSFDDDEEEMLDYKHKSLYGAEGNHYNKDLEPKVNWNRTQRGMFENETKYYIDKSNIQGQGAFAQKNYPEGTVIDKLHDILGQGQYNFYELGKMYNHSETPNCKNIMKDNTRYLVTIQPVEQGEELTADYRLQPDLEQPENFLELYNKPQSGEQPYGDTTRYKDHWKSSDPGPKTPVQPNYKYKRGGMYSGGGMGFGGMYESRGGETELHIYDFDETIARVETPIPYTVKSPEGKEIEKGETTSIEFEEKKDFLKSSYDEGIIIDWDFKAFASMISTATLNNEIFQQLLNSIKNPNAKVTILTARAVGLPVTQFLKDQGIWAYVVPLGLNKEKGQPVTGEDKANWIESRIKKTTKKVLFIDDSAENRKAIYTLRDKLPNIEFSVETPPEINEDKKMKENALTKNWWKNIINEILLTEGGAPGHMAHPFDLDNVNSGKDLIEIMKKSFESLQKNPGSVKIDGTNTSVRLIDVNGEKQFAMDRGSKKDIDVKGITKDDLTTRFKTKDGSPHGMVAAGGKVLDLFNGALPYIENDLKKIGSWDNSDILFNTEYVAGKTNVQQYDESFLAIHDVKEMKMIEEPSKATGKPLIKRKAINVNVNSDVFQSLIDNFNKYAQTQGFKIYGQVATEVIKKPAFNSALSKNYKLKTNEGDINKSLKTLLDELDVIPKEDFIFMNGVPKEVGAVSKRVYTTILDGGNIDELFESEEDKSLAIKGFTTYLATEMLGQEVLKVLDSPMGTVDTHEGVVIRDENIANQVFKLSGEFIRRGMVSDFN